jgi:hypothetical protein
MLHRLFFVAVATGAAIDRAWSACITLDLLALFFMVQMFRECSSAMAAVNQVLKPANNTKK